MLWKALLVEIKNSITKNWYLLIRYFGLLIIPLIYGFSYIFAFYDPFVNTKDLGVAVVTQKGDFFGDALGKSLEQEKELHVGELEMTMKMKHIYSDEETEDTIKDNYATLKVPNLYEDVKLIVQDLVTGTATPITAFTRISNLINKDHGKFEVYTNNKKNYLIAFGVDIGLSMSGTIDVALNSAIDALKDPKLISHLQTDITGWDASRYTSFLAQLDSFKGIHPIKVEADGYTDLHGNKNNKYGYGLAPFFISVAMWIGGMVMTFAIHRKIYDTKATPTQRYFAKWILINVGVVIQATILLFALYFIGFKELGDKNFFTLYGFTILTGMIFSSIIQAIRFCIYDRNISIFIVILFLVLQMASGGGLFPVDTQQGFYRTLNKFVPMGHSVRLFREAAVSTNWSNLMTSFGYLSLYLLIIPVGVYINYKRTIRLYKNHSITLPDRVVKIEAHKERLKKKLKSKGGE